MKQLCVLLLVVLTSCHSRHQEVIDIPHEAGIVQSIVLDSLAASMKLDMILLLDTTIVDYTLNRLQPAWTRMPLSKGKDSLSNKIVDLVPGWLEMSPQHTQIDESALHTQCTHRQIPFSQADTMYNPRRGTGIVAISHVAFSSDSLYALVLVEDFLGGLHGAGQFVLLKKTGSHWQTLRWVLGWIS
jgi:hypothetical protein